MIYCKCSLLPVYSEFGGKTNDNEDCKKWLAEQNPELHHKLYQPIEADEEKKEGEEVKKRKKSRSRLWILKTKRSVLSC